MALSALTIATAEQASETKEKNEWVRDAGLELPYSDKYPDTRRKAKEVAYHLGRRVDYLSVCDGLPPIMQERARIAGNIISSISAGMDLEDEEAAK